MLHGDSDMVCLAIQIAMKETKKREAEEEAKEELSEDIEEEVRSKEEEKVAKQLDTLSENNKNWQREDQYRMKSRRETRVAFAKTIQTLESKRDQEMKVVNDQQRSIDVLHQEKGDMAELRQRELHEVITQYGEKRKRDRSLAHLSLPWHLNQ